MVLDQLRLLVWQQTKQGQKNKNRPKPLSPLAKEPNVKHVGQTDRPAEEVAAMLDRVARGEQVWKGRPRAVVQ